jgi:hypothetical protein
MKSIALSKTLKFLFFNGALNSEMREIHGIESLTGEQEISFQR